MSNRAPRTPLSDEEFTQEQLDTTKMLRVNGVLANGFRVGMRSWKLFKAHLPFSLHVMALSSVPPRIRELAIIRIAHNNHCDYELQHHTQVGLTQLGLTQDDIENIKLGADAPGLSELDSYVIKLVDQLATDCNVSDEVHDFLNKEFNQDQFSELLFTIGNYESMTRVINVLGIPMDEDFDKMHGLTS